MVEDAPLSELPSVKTRLLVCKGSDCRKSKSAHKKILNSMGDVCPSRTIKCQGICKGPVVVVRRGSERLYFEKVRGKKVRRHLRDFLEGGPLTARLEKRVVARR